MQKINSEGKKDVKFLRWFDNPTYVPFPQSPLRVRVPLNKVSNQASNLVPLNLSL